MPESINLHLSLLLLTKEAGEVKKQPFIQGTKKLQGVCARGATSWLFASAHAKGCLLFLLALLLANAQELISYSC